VIHPFTVSIHIPKTAGTTVAEVFSRAKQRRILYDYEGYENPRTPSSLIRSNVDFITQYFHLLHGHFYASKYLDVFPNAHFISTIRHPVDRVISQYMHEFNEHSNTALFHEAIKLGTLDVVEFAEQPGIGNAFSLHLAGRPLNEYDLILLSERLLESLSIYSVCIDNLQLQANFGLPVQLPSLNLGHSRANRLEFDDKTRTAIFERTHPDNEIYKEASALLDVKIKKYL